MRLPAHSFALDVRRIASLLRSTSTRALLAAVVGLTAVQACTSVEVVGVRVGSVEVTPGSATITEGAVLQFRATVRDEAGTPIPQAQVTWSVGEPAVAQIDGNGLVTGLASGTTPVRATFQGNSGQATLTVDAANSAPTAAITAPADGSSFTQGDAITFTGRGTDPEDGALSATRLAWTSQIDGSIGTGASFTTRALSIGTHIITLRATDSGGATGSTQIGLTVGLGVAPAVTSITPNRGTPDGGTPITIAGTDFESGATVAIGGAQATNVAWVDATTITATTPAGAVGTVDVVVTNPDAQTGTLAGGFTYTPGPGVNAVTPSGGSTAGGTSVTITGSGFESGATVTIGGTPATNVVVRSGTTITATTPPGSAGEADVVVTNPDTRTGTLAGGYTYAPAPTVTSISPNTGPTSGGTAVTIVGTGFVPGATVTIGGVAPANVVVGSSTSITATTRVRAAGTFDVVVTNPDTQTGTLANGFTYLPGPTVTSITPSGGSTAGGTAVTITGTGFVSGATVTVGGAAAANVVWVDATSITATTPAGAAGIVDVVVTNPDAQTGTLVGGYTYAPAPTVTAITPDTGPTSGGTGVTITGTGFVDGATVTIGGVAATDVVWVDATSLTATTPGFSAGAADVVVTNPDGQAGTLVGGFTYLPGPAVTAITPTSGPTSGGTAVTVTGTGFVSGATVTIGGVTTTDVVFIDATSITATTPAGAAGAADVAVTNPDTQTSTLAGGFTYVPPPTVTSISPSSGPAAGGTAVTITGTGFLTSASVTIGGVPATGVTFNSATSITATTAARAAGTVDVVVTNPDTQTGTLSNGFTYDPAPTVTSISPANGPTAGGTAVTITGTDFVVGATVTIGGVAATSVGFVNSTSLNATTPVNPAGPADVVVENPDEQSDTLTEGFTYDPGPTVGSISPDSGPTSGGTLVTITGTGLVDGASVTIGGNAATGLTFVSATQITATTPAGAEGPADVVVTNPDLQTGTLTEGFTYQLPAPSVTSISPGNGPASGGTSVTIAGTDFVDGATVTIGGVATTGLVFNGPTSLTATTPAGAEGPADVEVVNPDAQTGTLTDGFTYDPPPSVTSVSPSSGPTAGGTSITIIGTDFVSQPTVTIGGVQATDVGFFSATQITATTPAGAAGPADVEVENPDGQTGTLTDGFTYQLPAPSVTSISPGNGPASGGTSVTIVGTDFVDGATVTIGGVATTGLVFNGPTSLTATTPAGAEGPADVEVENPDAQTGTLADGFTYDPPPSVDSISPATGLTAGGTSVTITGTDFVDGATVTIGGVEATGVTFNSATSITVTTPAGSAGPADVEVENPDGQTGTLTDGFTYQLPAPSVTSISPGNGPASGGTSVTIVGTDFVDGATVTIGGVATTGLVFNGPTSLTATTPAGAEGPADVVVTHPDAQTGTLADGFTYDPPPSVGSISPATGLTAGGTSVTITGTDFVDGATVTIGGVEATGVTFNSATSITVTTPAGSAGPADVEVENPDGQTGTLTDGFTYQLPAPSVTSISPGNGPASGGTSVTIVGTDFVDGATVTIGGVATTGLVFNGPTSLTVTTPAGAEGPADVVVTHPDAQTGTLADGFTYDPPPSVDSISPATGTTAGGTPVTITGTDFVDGATVTIGGVEATGVTFNSSTSITVTTPAGSAGPADVEVENPDGQTGTLAGGFTYS